MATEKIREMACLRVCLRVELWQSGVPRAVLAPHVGRVPRNGRSARNLRWLATQLDCAHRVRAHRCGHGSSSNRLFYENGTTREQQECCRWLADCTTDRFGLADYNFATTRARRPAYVAAAGLRDRSRRPPKSPGMMHGLARTRHSRLGAIPTTEPDAQARLRAKSRSATRRPDDVRSKLGRTAK